MKQVRDYFGIPPRQRWTTVARRGDFRRLLAPGENPRNLAPMLKNLYKLRGDATAQATLRRSVAGAARLAQTQAQIADGATESGPGLVAMSAPPGAKRTPHRTGPNALTPRDDAAPLARRGGRARVCAERGDGQNALRRAR